VLFVVVVLQLNRQTINGTSIILLVFPVESGVIAEMSKKLGSVMLVF